MSKDNCVDCARRSRLCGIALIFFFIGCTLFNAYHGGVQGMLLTALFGFISVAGICTELDAWDKAKQRFPELTRRTK